MEMTIANQKDRGKLIHAIVYAPIGSVVVVITTKPIDVADIVNSSSDVPSSAEAGLVFHP